MISMTNENLEIHNLKKHVKVLEKQIQAEFGKYDELKSKYAKLQANYAESKNSQEEIERLKDCFLNEKNISEFLTQGNIKLTEKVKTLEDSRDELLHELQYQKGLVEGLKYGIDQNKVNTTYL